VFYIDEENRICNAQSLLRIKL